MPQNAGEVRFAAQSLYQNAPNYRTHGPPMPRSLSQSASINLYTDDFLSGFMEDGRMSVVRRFFCLFVTFDLFFISLLWLICILINGADIYDALKQQILLYDVHKSLFDVVGAAVFRFGLLILFYAILSTNHWFIIALSTTTSCAFLIYKVFVFNWIDTKEPVFQVLLIIISFVLAWGETWFLDCRVIPQEKHARNYLSAVQPYLRDEQRAPLVAPFLEEVPEPATSTFYSPYETIHNSDEEDDAQDEEWCRMGDECVLRATQLLESGDWQIDRVTDVGDTIKYVTLPKMGKVWRVTAKVNFPAKLLLENLFHKIDEMHTWNTTILESKILHKINNHTDISYQLTAGAGIVKSRDFVNLRCWQLCRNGKIVRGAAGADNEGGDDDDDRPPSFAMPSLASTYTPPPPSMADSTTTATVHRVPEDRRRLLDFTTITQSSAVESDAQQSAPAPTPVDDDAGSNGSGGGDVASRSGLGKSMGASGFFDADVQSGDDELEFADAEGDYSPAKFAPPTLASGAGCAASEFSSGNLYVSSAISIANDKWPAVPKYTRGENRLSCWAMREINGKPNECIFEWLMCVDLKGYLPHSVLNKVYPTIIQDYMVALRKHCENLKAEHRRQQRTTATLQQS